MSNFKKFKRNFIWIVTSFLILIVITFLTYSQEKIMVQDKEFAQKSLSGYLEFLSPDNVTNFGFKSIDEAKTATLGDPIRVLMISLEDLKNYKVGEGIKSILKDIKTTWYPVQLRGQTKAKIEISEKDGEMIAGDFGDALNAQYIASLLTWLPDTLGAWNIQENYVLSLIKIPVITATFIYVESEKQQFLISAMLNPGLFEIEENNLYKVDYILSKLKEYVKDIKGDKVI